MTTETVGRLALLWRGDREARRQATPENNRWHKIFAELAARKIQAEPCVYCEEAADEVRTQLRNVDGVLVWVDPLSDGRTRFQLDAMLREVASRGVWVSTHPDVTLKIGVKEVLHTTRHLGWGTDTHLYRTFDEFQDALPRRLASEGPRVIKQNRGNGGQGVWKVEIVTGPGRLCGGAGSTSRQRAPELPACRLHRQLCWVLRRSRLHHRPAVPATSAGRDDPMLCWR